MPAAVPEAAVPAPTPPADSPAKPLAAPDDQASSTGRLPPELLHIVCKRLRTSKALHTLATIMTVSHATYDIAASHLYTDVTFKRNHDVMRHLFDGLYTVRGWERVDRAAKGEAIAEWAEEADDMDLPRPRRVIRPRNIFGFDNPLDPALLDTIEASMQPPPPTCFAYPYPNAQSHQRKLDLLRRIKTLRLEDDPSVKRCADLMEAAKRGVKLFANVEQLVLEGELVYRLADHNAGGYHQRHLSQDVIKAHLSPKHLCIQWTHQQPDCCEHMPWEVASDFVGSKSGDDYGDDWQGENGRIRIHDNMTRVIENCLLDWQLESLTQHGIEDFHKIALSGQYARACVFYAECYACFDQEAFGDEDAYMTECSCDDASNWYYAGSDLVTRDHASQLSCTEWQLINVGNNPRRYYDVDGEIVWDHPPPGWTATCRQHMLDGLAESVSEWTQLSPPSDSSSNTTPLPKFRVLAPAEADPCVCCGRGPMPLVEKVRPQKKKKRSAAKKGKSGKSGGKSGQ